MKALGDSGVFIDFKKGINVYGCIGVEKYSLDEIVLQLRSERIVLCGEKFLLSSFFDGEILITGELKSISVERG